MHGVRKTSFIFSFYIVLSAFYVHHSVCKEVILETGKCPQYFERSVEDPDRRTTAWTPNKDFNDHYCSICNSQDTAESWLVTKPIQVEEDYVASVYVNVKVYSDKCPKCKNQAIKAFILRKRLPQDQKDINESVKILKRLTSVATIENEEDGEEKIHQFYFEPKKSQFSLVFLSTGSCTLIRDITVSYYYCEKDTSSGIILPKTFAPFNGSQRVNVSCPKNSLNRGNEELEAYGLCSSKGIWEIISPCVCNKGYTFNIKDEECIECPINTYKNEVRNGKCTPCPRYSESLRGKLQCMCKNGFYRFQGENYTYPCYGVPFAVRDITYIDRTETSITLLWTPPLPSRQSDGANQTVLYDVECKKCSPGSDSWSCVLPCGRFVTFIPFQNNLTHTNVTIQGLDQNTEYQFVIYSKNMNSLRINKTNWKRVVKKIQTKVLISEVSKSDGLPTAVVIVISVVAIVIIIIIIFVICLFERHKIRARQRSDRGIPLLPGVKTYIDPTTYNNSKRAVSEFAKELDRNMIEFEEIIAGGAFGDVYKGEIKTHPGQPAIKVAIKTLKARASEKDRSDFLIEASIMGQFKHLNVIALEGVVTKSAPLLIVTEFMENGSLDRYLKKNDGTLNLSQLLKMARGVASGMEYLSGMLFIHRDLAARNVLVSANLACKVADFGLSRDVSKTEESEYETQGGKVPVRWTAPEAMMYLKFSTASDIWSYGILLWEIMSFAERPYWNWRNQEVITKVAEGYRLPAPMNCPKTVHQLMEECCMVVRQNQTTTI